MIFANEEVSLKSFKVTTSSFQSEESLSNLATGDQVKVNEVPYIEACEEEKTLEDPLPLLGSIAAEVTKVEESRLIEKES